MYLSTSSTSLNLPDQIFFTNSFSLSILLKNLLSSTFCTRFFPEYHCSCSPSVSRFVSDAYDVRSMPGYASFLKQGSCWMLRLAVKVHVLLLSLVVSVQCSAVKCVEGP